MEIKSVDLLNKVMDNLLKRAELINNNIANSTTPNFKRTDLSFKQELDKQLDIPKNNIETENNFQLKTTHEKHIKLDEENKKTVTENNTIQNNNGNNVDIEKEMLESMKTAELYGVLSKKVSGKFNQIKTLFKDSSN